MTLNNGKGFDGVDGFDGVGLDGLAQKYKSDDFGPVVLAMIVVIVVIVAFTMSLIGD